MSKAEDMIKEDSKYFATSGRIKYYPLVIDHGYGGFCCKVKNIANH
ncbi:hypothetical protein ACUXFM_001719 [Staphylococcus hominis]